MQTMMGAPYALGAALLELAIATDGNEAVDALFRDPPTSDEQLLDPWTVVNDRDDPLAIAKVRVSPGEDRFESGTFGALTWYVMLAERLPLLEALDAVDGWGADAYAGFERDGVTCVRVRYEGDTAHDQAEMRSALQDWVSAVGSPTASVRADDGTLLFESCDPGAAAEVGRDDSDRALGLAVTRTYLGVNILEASGNESVARCFANEYVHTFTLEQVQDPEFGAGDEQLQEQVQQMAEGCAASG